MIGGVKSVKLKTSQLNPSIKLKIINPNNLKAIFARALIDTGANMTFIPAKFAEILDLQFISTVQYFIQGGGRFEAKQYSCSILIDSIQTLHEVVGMEGIIYPILGIDFLKKIPYYFSIIEKLSNPAIKLNPAIDITEFIKLSKEKNILIIGQDTSEIGRLYAIKERLKHYDYIGLLAKDINDIKIQNLEEKIVMLASISRYVICENSFASGHIDELKICKDNRFVTAIIEEQGKCATSMQIDYPDEHNFIKKFYYSNIADIDSAVDKALNWAENKVVKRQRLFNKRYDWRKEKE